MSFFLFRSALSQLPPSDSLSLNPLFVEEPCKYISWNVEKLLRSLRGPSAIEAAVEGSRDGGGFTCSTSLEVQDWILAETASIGRNGGFPFVASIEAERRI